jgi:hypothetical protein
MWIIWVARNDRTFNHNHWPTISVESAIWNGLIEYGKIAWAKVKSARYKSQTIQDNALK